MQSLAGSAFLADETLGAGRVISFSIDPNFRAWTLGTQRLLWNAIVGPDVPPAARSAAVSKDAVVRARQAERSSPEVGAAALRIAVSRDQASDARAALRTLGVKVHTTPRGDLRILSVENLDSLGLEESRQLARVMPTLASAGVTIEWANLPGP